MILILIKNSKILGFDDKSITATHFGILEKQGKFDINKPAPIKDRKMNVKKLQQKICFT
jgi:hypothetical protein